MFVSANEFQVCSVFFDTPCIYIPGQVNCLEGNPGKNQVKDKVR